MGNSRLFCRFSLMLLLLLTCVSEKSYAAYCNECFSWDCSCGTRDYYTYQNYSESGDCYESPCENSCFNMFRNLTWKVDGAYLFWRAFEGETQFVISGVPSHTDISGGNVGAIGTLESAEFNWASGFRVGGELGLPEYQLKLVGDFTSITNAGSDGASVSGSRYLNDIFGDFDGAVATACSSIRLYTRMWNLYFLKDLTCNCDFSTAFYMGITGANIHQNWHVLYSGDQFNAYSLDWSYEGVGLRTGLDFAWNFASRFSIVGNVSGALFCGEYNNKGTMTVLGDLLIESPFYDYRLTQQRIVPHFQLSLGPEMRVCFFSIEMDVYALWELNVFNNLHYIYKSQSGTPIEPKDFYSTNSLTGLQGLTLGFRFSF